VALAGLPVLCLGASTLLRLFNPAYTSAATALVILAFTILPMAVKYHYVAIERVRGRLTRAAVATTLGAALEVAATIAGGSLHGMSGLAVGLLAAQILEAACFGPSIVGVLHGSASKAAVAQGEQA
jgi:O-antigen/teichoic acid export membrane protein